MPQYIRGRCEVCGIEEELKLDDNGKYVCPECYLSIDWDQIDINPMETFVT